MYINSNTEHIHEHLTYQKNQNEFFQQSGTKEIKGENYSKNINKQEAHGPHRSPEKTVQINKHK